MPAPLLGPELQAFTAETQRLSALLTTTTDIAATHRKLIAEIAHLRLAILIENHFEGCLRQDLLRRDIPRRHSAPVD